VSWTLYRPSDGDPRWHVAPDFGRTHTFPECWCEPEPDTDVPEVLIHHEEH
jgi:hypothetical protein